MLMLACTIFLSFFLTFGFIYSQTPLGLALIIVLQALLIATSVYIFSSSPWFSFILLMIFISGMMIIFIYVSSLSSNFVFTHPPTLTSPVMLLLISIALFSSIKMVFIVLSTSTQFQAFHNPMIFALYKMYSTLTSSVTLLLISYLLLVLFVTVKNSAINLGPLRLKI